MWIFIPVVAILLAGCAASPPPSPQISDEQKALGERIEKICSLPDAAEREAQIAELKKESGLVLYCGGK